MEKIGRYPLVSVFAVCHKHAPYVIETLDSIRNQTYSNLELIIINNVKDECEVIISDWIKEHEVKCVFIQNECPKTVTQNCNDALALCNGKYFQGFSCDDTMLPQKIERQVDLFESLDERYACVYSDMILFDDKGVNFKDTYFLKRGMTGTLPNGNLRSYLNSSSFIPAPSILMRREVMVEVGGYDENLPLEDWPLYLEISRRDYLFFGVNEPLVKYRHLHNSLGKIRNKNFLVALKTIFSKYKNIMPDNKDAKKKWLGFSIELFKYSPKESVSFFMSIFNWSKGRLFIEFATVLKRSLFN